MSGAEPSDATMQMSVTSRGAGELSQQSRTGVRRVSAIDDSMQHADRALRASNGRAPRLIRRAHQRRERVRYRVGVSAHRSGKRRLLSCPKWRTCSSPSAMNTSSCRSRSAKSARLRRQGSARGGGPEARSGHRPRRRSRSLPHRPRDRPGSLAFHATPGIFIGELNVLAGQARFVHGLQLAASCR